MVRTHPGEWQGVRVSPGLSKRRPITFLGELSHGLVIKRIKPNVTFACVPGKEVLPMDGATYFATPRLNIA